MASPPPPAPAAVLPPPAPPCPPLQLSPPPPTPPSLASQSPVAPHSPPPQSAYAMSHADPPPPATSSSTPPHPTPLQSARRSLCCTSLAQASVDPETTASAAQMMPEMKLLPPPAAPHAQSPAAHAPLLPLLLLLATPEPSPQTTGQPSGVRTTSAKAHPPGSFPASALPPAPPAENALPGRKRSYRGFLPAPAATPRPRSGTVFLPSHCGGLHIPVQPNLHLVAATCPGPASHSGSAAASPSAHTQPAPCTPAACPAGAPATRWFAARLFPFHCRCYALRFPALAPHTPPDVYLLLHLPAPALPLPSPLNALPAPSRSPPTQCGIHAPSPDGPSAPETRCSRFLNISLNLLSGTSFRPAPCYRDRTKTFPPSTRHDSSNRAQRRLLL